MSRGRPLAILAAAALAIPAAASPAAAHEFRPAVLDVTDLGSGRYDVTWAPPSAGGDPDASSEVTPTFPDGCRLDGSLLDCGPAGLAGRPITLRNLGAARADALVRFDGPSGLVTAVLREDAPTFLVPGATPTPATSRLTRARGYVGAGMAHILHGPDHLLFVLGLLLLVHRARRPGASWLAHAAALARTVTAFTLAHSLTLALAATGTAHLPPAPVEAAIALSLVLLAGELARPDGAAPRTLARRRPALLAFAFGLLHGLGFAGGLAALRVPASDLPLALAGFNLGVELGQLAFVAAVLLALPLLRRLVRSPRATRLAALPAYAVGTLGAFFLLDRVAAFWRP